MSRAFFLLFALLLIGGIGCGGGPEIRDEENPFADLPQWRPKSALPPSIKGVTRGQLLFGKQLRVVATNRWKSSIAIEVENTSPDAIDFVYYPVLLHRTGRELVPPEPFEWGSITLPGYETATLLVRIPAAFRAKVEGVHLDVRGRAPQGGAR